jgi:hypothetical protein
VNQVEEIIQWLFANESKEMKKICNKEMMRFGGISEMDYDDFYSQVGWDISKAKKRFEKSFDTSQEKTFKEYIYGVIKLSVWKQMSKRNRSKRQVIIEKEVVDSEGNIVTEKEYIQTTSLDAPIGDEDGVKLSDYLYSDISVENEIFGDVYDEKVELFLKELPKIQRKIIEMKMKQHTSDEIKQSLDISDREYNSAMKSIQMNENLSLFTKNINDCGYKEEEQMERVMEINEADNYRMDKRSMFSLLEDKKSGDINCKYILQRKPFQWTQEERNRYICRILSNLPIPEIILCEQNIKGLMIDHLIDGLQRLSYAEAYKENRFKVGANGAERHLIKYREFLVDENGTRILDEDGVPVYEEKICDVVGKHYKDLPDELKKRFNNFNVNVTKFFNCTDEQIADHIRDYNNHASMNNEQLGMTKISADTARKIKAIAEKNTFFKNCGKFTDTTSTKGKLDKIVSESIMLLFHRDEWKSKIDKAYQFIDENATDEEFLGLNSDLNRLELALGEENKEIKEMFTVASTPMWLAVFHEFITYNMEDARFVDFMSAYKNELNQKEIDGVSMDDFKDKQSKKKATIKGKIELLVKLMKAYLHVEEDKEMTTKEFISAVVDVPINVVEEDIGVYEEDLKGLKNTTIRDGSKLLEVANHLSLLAMVAYAYKNDITLDYWLEEYAANNNTYDINQQQNYLHMVSDLEKYQKRVGIA